LKNNGADLHFITMRTALGIRKRTNSFSRLQLGDGAVGWCRVIGFYLRVSVRAAWDGIGHVPQKSAQRGSRSPRDPRSGLWSACWWRDDGWFRWCHHLPVVARVRQGGQHCRRASGSFRTGLFCRYRGMRYTVSLSHWPRLATLTTCGRPDIEPAIEDGGLVNRGTHREYGRALLI